MKDPYGLSKATIPVAYAQLLLEIVVERGFSAERLLRESELPKSLLTITDGRLTPKQWSRLVWNTLQLTGDESLGYEYGLRLRPTAHGVLGFALISSATIRQAIELASIFFGMRVRDYRMESRIEADIVVINIIETHPIVAPKPEQTALLRKFFHESLILGILHTGILLTGDHLSDIEIYVDWPEPTYHAQYHHRLPTIRFNQPANQIRMGIENLELPLQLADPMAHQHALILCEQEQIKYASTVDELVARVQAELSVMLANGNPSLDAVAEKLHMSARTLKRHLQKLNTTYIELLDAIRRQEAEKLLASTEMDIQGISSALGYFEPGNFTRAFKKWTGETPSKFRQRVTV